MTVLPVLPSNLGMQHKCYLLEHPDAVDETDPTYHPKYDVLFRKSLHGSSWRWHSRDSLRREISETLVNCLYWAAIPTEPGEHSTYVPDAAVESQPGGTARPDAARPHRRGPRSAGVVDLGAACTTRTRPTRPAGILQRSTGRCSASNRCWATTTSRSTGAHA